MTNSTVYIARTLIALAIGSVVVSLFWVLVSPNVSLEAWKISALPAAVAGLLIGWLLPWKWLRWGVLVAVVLFSVVLGEIAIESVRIKASLESQQTPDVALRAIIGAYENSDSDKSPPKGSPAPENIQVEWSHAVELATIRFKDSVSTLWQELGISLALSLFVAWKASSICRPWFEPEVKKAA